MPRRPTTHPDHQLPDLFAADVGARIRKARTERGMTLAQLGGTDLSRSFLSLVENGKARISLHSLGIVARRLDVPISSFFPDDTGARETLAELLLTEAEIAVRNSKPDDALHLLDQVEVTDASRARALWLRGWSQLLQSRFKDAVSILEDALSAVARSEDPRLAPEIHYRLGRGLYALERYEDALKRLEAGVNLAGTEDDPVVIGRFRVMIGHILYIQDEFERALAQYTSARELLEAVSDLDGLAGVYSGLSLMHRKRGDNQQALRYARLALGIYEARDRQHDATYEINNLAVYHEELDDLDSAFALAERAVERAVVLGAPVVEATARATRALVLFRLGRLDEARAEAERAENLAPAEAESERASAWVVQARIAERDGDPERADTLFQRALDVFERIGAHTRFVDAAYDYSDVLAERGDAVGALKWSTAVRRKTRRRDRRRLT